MEVVLKKTCNACFCNKAIEEFHANRTGKYGRHQKCKDCMRKYVKVYYKTNKTKIFAKRYGVTEEEIVDVLDKKCCEICGATETRLCIDHCHETGKIRGLLCETCNTAIGKLKDDVQILKNAVKYLTKEK